MYTPNLILQADEYRSRISSAHHFSHIIIVVVVEVYVVAAEFEAVPVIVVLDVVIHEPLLLRGGLNVVVFVPEPLRVVFWHLEMKVIDKNS